MVIDVLVLSFLNVLYLVKLYDIRSHIRVFYNHTHLWWVKYFIKKKTTNYFQIISAEGLAGKNTWPKSESNESRLW